MKDNEIRFHADGNKVVHDKDKSSVNPKTRLKPISLPTLDFYFTGYNSETDFLVIQIDSANNYLITGHDYQIVSDRLEADKLIGEWKND